MKKVTQIRIWLLVSALIVSFSCTKGDDEGDDEQIKPLTSHYISSSMYGFMFNVGTYWIYENDSTQKLDSIVVTNIKQGFFYTPPQSSGTGPTSKVEYFKIVYFSYKDSINYNDFIFSNLMTRDGNESPKFGQPVLLRNYYIGYKLYGTEIIDTNSNINLFGNNFADVEEMKVNYSEQRDYAFSKDTYLYYKDSIGLIRKVYDSGNGNFDSWSLKRWNVKF